MQDRDKYLERQRRYNQSDKGRERNARYEGTANRADARERSRERERVGLVLDSTQRSRIAACRRDEQAMEKLLGCLPVSVRKILANHGIVALPADVAVSSQSTC